MNWSLSFKSVFLLRPLCGKKKSNTLFLSFWCNYSRTMECPAGFTPLADVLLPLYALEIDGHVLPLWMNVNTAISPRCLLPWRRGTQSWCHHTLSAACGWVVFLFFFFFFRYSLLFSFVVTVSRATICHHLSINTCCTHSYSSWVTRMQCFFPLIHFILLPLHIALVLSPAEESQVSHCSPLWCPSFSLVVLTDLSLLISLKEKPILHCTSFHSHLVELLCAILYIH